MNAPPAALATPDAGLLSIHAHRLTRIYTVGSLQVTGIDGIDLAVARGQLVVLKGDSGSGKSTLLS
ncbi:MAG: ATP-binding cassette domain-containing protein, partial [Desulfobacteraceae bacterium]|nr:ATP-binding cassette domain-containing protein [Desulfobacteraceae bacterium]